jgi:anti-sigma B factor antagonist/stage II sporulation protein AA (anti-sigma F factor antagonist)
MVETSSRQFADVVVAAPVGRVDHHSVGELEAALQPLVKKAGDGKGVLVLDFAGVDYISSVGLRILMIAAKELRVAGAKIAIANLRRSSPKSSPSAASTAYWGFSDGARRDRAVLPAGLVSFDGARPPAAQ